MNRTRTSSTPPIATRSASKQRVIDEAREFWEPRVGRPLGDEDARQIAENVVGFFDLLRKWDSEEKAREAESEKGS